MSFSFPFSVVLTFFVAIHAFINIAVNGALSIYYFYHFYGFIGIGCFDGRHFFDGLF